MELEKNLNVATGKKEINEEETEEGSVDDVEEEYEEEGEEKDETMEILNELMELEKKQDWNEERKTRSPKLRDVKHGALNRRSVRLEVMLEEFKKDEI